MSEQNKTQMSWRLRTLLYTSLAVNLLVLGIGAGILAQGGPKPEPNNGAERGGTAYIRALDPEQRDALRKQLRNRFDGEQGIGGRQDRDRGQIYLDIVAAMKADPFDREALIEIFDDQTDHNAERIRRGQNELRDFILSMDDDARIAFADRLAADIEAKSQRRPIEPPRD